MTSPEKPPTVPLGAEELEAVKIARRGVIPAMRHLVKLTQQNNSSQARQAIEVLFQYGLANRQQQYDFVNGQPVENGDTNIAISLNKVELRLTEVMQNLPPELAHEAALFIERIENYAQGINLDIIDGEILSEIVNEDAPFCACGCNERVNKLRSGPKRGQWAEFKHGHHLRGHMTHNRIPPREIARLKAAGQWPPKDDDGNKLYGTDKKKAASAKKAAIKAKKQKRIEDMGSGIIEGKVVE